MVDSIFHFIEITSELQCNSLCLASCAVLGDESWTVLSNSKKKEKKILYLACFLKLTRICKLIWNKKVNLQMSTISIILHTHKPQSVLGSCTVHASCKACTIR